jgi:hypothetical protein
MSAGPGLIRSHPSAPSAFHKPDPLPSAPPPQKPVPTTVNPFAPERSSPPWPLHRAISTEVYPKPLAVLAFDSAIRSPPASPPPNFATRQSANQRESDPGSCCNSPAHPVECYPPGEVATLDS